MVKRRHKGFTLIETIVAFAVLGIAVLGIGGFFVSAARSYSSVNAETSLQYEAQLTLNQVENMLIDSTLGVNYNYVTSQTETKENNGFQFVEKDSDATGTAVSKVLYAFNVNEDDVSKLDLLLLKWVAAEKAIYYKEVEIQSQNLKVEDISIAGLTGWDLLAEDVVAFSVDLSEYDETKKVEINLQFENRSKDYHTTGTVLLRNNVLINELDISKIYEHITKVTQSTITGVDLTANTYVTVPGGKVQLITKVSGTGYPSQDIYQWQVATDSSFADNKIIYDSLVEYQTPPDTIIDTANKVLTVSSATKGEGTSFNETIYVRAIVKAKNDAGETVYLNDSISLGIKSISNIDVVVTWDPTLDCNANLADAEFSAASLINQKKEPPVIPTMVLSPENIVQMEATVIGSDTTLTNADKEIVWSLVAMDEGVIAEIDNTGLLEINRYSKTGTFTVRAALKLDKTVYVDYNVQVGTQYDSTNTTLAITTSKNYLNRGGNLSCSLTLNGKEVDNNDYDWSVDVISSNGNEISGTPVTINGEGGLFANYDLSYDYSYDVFITASLKSNSAITARTKITVPKVSLTIKPLVKYSEMGQTVRNITCQAIGLEDFDVKWSMAKDLNPNYFFTAWGACNITGSKGTVKDENNQDVTAGMADVVLGSATDPASNFTVKATLKNNTNYSATMRIFTGQVKMNITGPTTVVRKGTAQLDIQLTTNDLNLNVTKNDVSWEIADVKINGTSYSSLINSNISISKGLLTVGELFAADYVDNTVSIYVRAYSDELGLEDEHVVTIGARQRGIFPNYVLIPDLSGSTQIQFTNYDGANWYISRTGNSHNNQQSKVSIGQTTGLLQAAANDRSQQDNATYRLSLYVNKQSYEGYLRYGFENKQSYSQTKEISSSENTKYQFQIQKSDYYVYNNGEFYPVYYVKYVKLVWEKGNRGHWRWEEKESTRYAFVSSTTNISGAGQWYKYEYNDGGRWTKDGVTAPNNWDNAYFY